MSPVIAFSLLLQQEVGFPLQGMVVPTLLLGVAVVHSCSGVLSWGRGSLQGTGFAKTLLLSVGPIPEHLVPWRCDEGLLQAYSNAGAEQLGEFSACH